MEEIELANQTLLWVEKVEDVNMPFDLNRMRDLGMLLLIQNLI